MVIVNACEKGTEPSLLLFRRKGHFRELINLHFYMFLVWVNVCVCVRMCVHAHVGIFRVKFQVLTIGHLTVSV